MQDTMLSICATIAMAIMMTPIKLNTLTVCSILIIGCLFPLVWFAGLLRGLAYLVSDD